MIDEYAKRDNKFLVKVGLITLGVIVLVVIIILIIVNVNKNKECNNIYDNLKKQVEDYVKNNNLTPTVNGDYVEINISDLPNKVYLKESTCGGKVKYTKHNDEFILTYNLENCNYCTTKEKKWSSYTDKYSNRKKNIEAVATFNYVTVDEYSTKWSNWMASEKLSDELTDGINLPIDEKALPSVPKGGIISKIIKEYEIRYSYRDKRWKWYKNNNADYSNFSSTAPAGYPNKDTQTEIKSEATDWSMDYPEEQSYRVITRKTGYRWYKTEGKDKIYWKNGAYYPTVPEEGYQKDSETNVPMYSYYDKMWRWYKTEKRNYSSYSSSANGSFIYKDEGIYMYTSWTSYKNTSSLDSSNRSYREERTDIYSRFLIEYKIKSMEVLSNSLEKDEFEAKTGMTLEEMAANEKYEIITKFKYRYY